MIKRFYLFLLLILFSLIVSAQGDRLVDSAGNFKYQYNRTLTIDPANPKQAIVTFVFINGNEPIAICLRQEILKTRLSWVSTPYGTLRREKLVESITANLDPKKSIVWKYTIQNKVKVKKNKLTVEKAALLLINKDFVATKEILEPQKCK